MPVHCKQKVLFLDLRVFKLLSVHVGQLGDLVVDRFFHVEQLFLLLLKLRLLDFFLLLKVVVEAGFCVVLRINVCF